MPEIEWHMHVGKLMITKVVSSTNPYKVGYNIHNELYGPMNDKPFDDLDAAIKYANDSWWK